MHNFHLPLGTENGLSHIPQVCTFTRALKMVHLSERGVVIGSQLSKAVTNDRKERPCWSGDKEDLLLFLCFGSKGSSFLAGDLNLGFQKCSLIMVGVSET